jgi:hypothetical protein
MGRYIYLVKYCPQCRLLPPQQVTQEPTLVEPLVLMAVAVVAAVMVGLA